MTINLYINYIQRTMSVSKESGVEKSRRHLSFSQAGPDVPTCSLCLGQHRQCSTPASWKAEEARTLTLALNISVDDPVCSACRKDITRVLADSTYTPRWEKVQKKQCCIAQCCDSVFASLHKVTSTQLQTAFQTAGLKCTTPVIPMLSPLCKHHYHLVYN